MSAIIIDTETTGFQEPIEVIEFAYTDPIRFDGVLGNIYCNQYKPSKPIENGAMAAHNIINDDLKYQPTWPGFVPAPDLGYVIGHGVDYDWERLSKPNVKRIDTLALCRQIWPDENKHSLSAMVYNIHEHSNKHHARELVKHSHSARADVYMCWVLLQKLLEIGKNSMPLNSWEDVWVWSEVARVPTRMWLGKHRGLPMAEVPLSYRQWALKNMTDPPLDEYQRRALGG